MITRISSDKTNVEVGENDVKKIELYGKSNEKTTIYKVTYEDGTCSFVGLLKHEVERVDYYD